MCMKISPRAEGAEELDCKKKYTSDFDLHNNEKKYICSSKVNVPMIFQHFILFSDLSS